MPELPPGPRTPRLLQMIQWVRRPIPFMRACAAAYGDAFTVRLYGAPPFVFFSAPAAVRDIFTADPETLLAGRGNEVLRPVFGSNSILLLDGARHRRERKLLMPPFHGERMRLYGDVMRETADRSIDGWPVGQVFPLHRHMQQITLDIILRTVFGVEDGDRLARIRALLVEFLLLIGSSPVLLVRRLQVDLGPLTAWRRICRLQGEIDRLLYDEIARCRRETPESRTDIMAMLVAARDEDGQPMSDEEIRDELVTMLVAGHETTATSLSWVVHRLLQNPEALAQAQAEVAAVAGNGTASDGLTAEQIGRLGYLDAVIKETSRLNPILPTVARYLEAPARIGDHDLPAGCVASPCVYLTHRRPDVWPEPEAFRPERFLGTRVDPYTFFPFGGGLRHCLGAAFALYEMKIVLARMLPRVVLKPAPRYTVRVVRRSITFAPSGGLPVIREGTGSHHA